MLAVDEKPIPQNEIIILTVTFAITLIVLLFIHFILIAYKV